MSNPSLLDRLLAPGGLTPLYQPILEVDETSQRVVAVECLVSGPKGTNLESANILFDYVRAKHEERKVDRACVKVALEGARGLDQQLRLNINVHASTLGQDAEFAGFLATTAQNNGIDARRLTVEIVEHAPPWATPTFLRALDNLRAIGVRIALDDIGLGQSNFRMILDCRPNYFKVDRYFVNGCHNDFHRQAVLEAIAQLSRRFDAEVVAEGVAQKADLRTIVALGFRLVQGWYFHPALDAASVQSLLLASKGPHAPSNTPESPIGEDSDDSPKRSNMASKKVLLVDDSSTALMMEKTIIGQASYDLIIARDGQEAVNKAVAEKPDLILMDLVMPRMDGIEACRIIRSHAETSAVPIIMVTTRGEQKNVETAFSMGCTDYITKPINGLELLEKLRNYLGE